jgi:hypothetical protein
MQTLTRPSYSPTNNNTGDSQALRVAVLAVILFALSGLITGFAFGAFVHFSPTRTASSPTSINTTQQKTGGTTPVTTPQTNPQSLGLPLIQSYSYNEIANGTTIYKVVVQVTNQRNGPLAAGKALSVSGITCKLWLVQRIPDKKALNIPTSTLKNVQAIQSPITGYINDRPVSEISGLNFDPTTSQTQLSNTKGQATWQYQISPSVAPGNYDLVALTDWDGVHFNWSWYNIVISQAN